MEWVRKILVDQFDGMTRDEAEDWIDDLESHGCESGMVGCLIYYRDTRKVYEDNESEIISTLEDVEFSDEIKRGDLPCVDQIINRRVWAAFELSARGVFEDMADDMWPIVEEEEPSPVEIVTDGPNGPRVVYPADMSAEDVESELPYPWTVNDDDWGSTVTLADGRMSTPLSRYDEGT